ncbi:hypothetical protein JCM17844_24010 [Iodidimonas gelatinilytica]|nr:hypothetical protein [Iodidimonas gelatinilytica]GEQ98764.1 hypothetical protein JCM17844_24010 [Iodidimonas gelatinilytica]
MKNAMTVVILSVLLAAVGITTFIVLNELTAVTLSMHGYIALGLGIGFTLILGCA